MAKKKENRPMDKQDKTTPKRRGRLRFAPKQETPQLTDWTLNALSDLSDVIEEKLREAVGEALHHVLTNEETEVYFPHEWSHVDGRMGKASREDVSPLVVYLALALDDGNPHIYAFDLRDLLRDSLEARSTYEYDPALMRIRDALREMADEIDEALKDQGNQQADK